MQSKIRIFKIALMAIVICSTSCFLVNSSFGSVPLPGDVIDASNVDQYADYFPYFVQRYIKDGWGIADPTVVHVRAHEPNLPPKIFREMSEKNKGKVTLNADGSISGWECGLPFPDPKEPNLALKLLWNVNYHWRSDCLYYPDYFAQTSCRKGGTPIHTEADNRYIFWKNRTVVDPKPTIINNKRNLFFTSIFKFLTPPNKDLKILTWRYDDKRDDEMWTYVPTLRRSIRMMSSERQNPVNGLATTWDDFYGFEGKIDQYEPTFIGERKILYLCHQQTFAVGEFRNGIKHPLLSGPNDPWEVVEMWEVDVTHINPRSPEKKKTLYITKEAYHVPYAQIYDKQGDLWKGSEWQDTRIKTLDGENGPFQTEYSVADFKTGFWSGALLRTVHMNADLPVVMFEPGTFQVDF